MQSIRGHCFLLFNSSLVPYQLEGSCNMQATHPGQQQLALSAGHEVWEMLTDSFFTSRIKVNKTR